MDVVKHLIDVGRDWIAFPFVMVGNLFYVIGEFIADKKFTRRADMALLEDKMSGNRADRRARRRR